MFSNSQKPRIISVSRRTDIPAFFGDWFMEAVKRRSIEVPNPFNQQTYAVSLAPENVAAIVFWSKNFRPFLENLSLLEKMGFDKFIFNFTITGMSKFFEPSIPLSSITIRDFITLSERYGKKAVFWRFDPILFSDFTQEDYYFNRFREIAEQIAPYTERCIFSFTCFYHKVKRSLGKLEAEQGIKAYDVETSRKREMAEKLAGIASSYNLELHSCCCEYLEDIPGIKKSHCVDGALVGELWNSKYTLNLNPSREGCGCYESSDIGEYATCKGGCVYCYAN